MPGVWRARGMAGVEVDPAHGQSRSSYHFHRWGKVRARAWRERQGMDCSPVNACADGEGVAGIGRMKGPIGEVHCHTEHSQGSWGRPPWNRHPGRESSSRFCRAESDRIAEATVGPGKQDHRGSWRSPFATVSAGPQAFAVPADPYLRSRLPDPCSILSTAPGESRPFLPTTSLAGTRQA